MTTEKMPGNPREQRPTMMDVAAAAGVSQTTVSLVLNNALGARLSPTTRRRVMESANALGYRLVRRNMARAPAASASVIGFVADEISTDPWTAIALDGIREKAWENGISVTAAITRGDPEMEDTVFAQLASLPLAGVIYATIQTRRIKAKPALFRVPTVLLNCYIADRSLASVVPGEMVGGHTATRRLIQAGHRRIGHIQGEAWMDASRDRLKGYRRALADAEIVFDAELVRPGNWEPSAGYDQTLALLDLTDPPTAIFCANDMMAFGCYNALKQRGLRIPQDMAVIGYDDRDIAKFMEPPLTTVLLAHLEMGSRATEIITERQVRPRGRQPQFKVECPLVERDSVGAILD